MRELRETRQGKLLGRLYQADDGALLHISLRHGRVNALFDLRSGACIATDPGRIAELIRVSTRAGEV